MPHTPARTEPPRPLSMSSRSVSGQLLQQLNLQGGEALGESRLPEGPAAREAAAAAGLDAAGSMLLVAAAGCGSPGGSHGITQAVLGRKLPCVEVRPDR